MLISAFMIHYKTILYTIFTPFQTFNDTGHYGMDSKKKKKKACPTSSIHPILMTNMNYEQGLAGK